MGDFALIGTGLAVYQDDRVIEGSLRWLDSPDAVIDLVNSGRAAESVVLARGGTTTFLTPALTSGVRAILTLHGAPESHLGILSREYGIPCVMSVDFSQGVRSARGEVIPPDGAIVRVDVSSPPEGRVLIDASAPVEVTAEAGGDDQEQARIKRLLHHYRGKIPRGPEGDERVRAGLQTEVLTTGDDEHELTRDELNELLGYMSYNLWDVLALRATEGESGLIPRQEYEAVASIQIWQRYPQMQRFITEQVGVDGLHHLGELSRHEIGTKVNMLHIWCNGFALAMGRSIAMALGRISGNAREADLADSMQFMRRLYAGLRGPGRPLFSSMVGGVSPILDERWVGWLSEHYQPIGDPGVRDHYQRFSADAELMGFLMHFDSRPGLHDTGPYPMPDGGFLIVRDHFLSDELYHWADVAADLPHAVTQAMFFGPDTPLEVVIGDLGTVFTKPANYLKHLIGMAVFARDRWDTPPGQIRRLDDGEIGSIGNRCRAAANRLYRRIAAMPKRDKIAAGMQVYYTDFIAPFARAAGLWDRLKAEFDFYEWDPVTSEAYYDLVRDRAATPTFSRLVLNGAYPPVRDPISHEEAFPALHLIAVRGACQDLPVDANELVNAGLVAESPSGYLLTETGRNVHARQLEHERRTYETERLAQAYERFLALNAPMKALVARWQERSTDPQARAEMLAELTDIIQRVRVALRRSNEQLLRFEPYLPRMRRAAARVEAGESEYLASPTVDSVHTIWLQLHEDYLLTQGISREQEGSY